MTTNSSNPLLPYPGLAGRVFLDYPLDILLNRECSLKSHEAGLVPLLGAYERAASKVDRRVRRQLSKLILDDWREVATLGHTDRWSDGILDWNMARDGAPDGFRDDSSRNAFEEDLERLRSAHRDGQLDTLLRLHLLLRDRFSRDCPLQGQVDQVGKNLTLELLRDYRTLSLERKQSGRTLSLAQVDDRSPRFIGRWASIPSAGMLPSAFRDLVKDVLVHHLALCAYFEQDVLGSKTQVQSFIQEYVTALAALDDAQRALQYLWTKTDPQTGDSGTPVTSEAGRRTSDAGWREARVLLSLNLLGPASLERWRVPRVPFEAMKAFEDTASRALKQVRTSVLRPELLRRALELRLLLRDGVPQLKRQALACRDISDRLGRPHADKDGHLPRGQSEFFSDVRDWSALAAGRWVDAFSHADTAGRLERAIRTEQRKAARAPQTGTTPDDVMVGLALVCGKATRVEALAHYIERALADYEGFRLSLALGPVVTSIRERTDWSAMVRDWRPIAEQESVDGWRPAFDDDLQWGRFRAQLRQLTTRYGGRRSDVELLLGLHLLLRDRTIGALQLPVEPAAGGAPMDHVPWTGNIILQGHAGSGKSTLAAQLALAFTHWPNNYNAIYLALEEGADNIRAKARRLSPGWCGQLSPVAFHDDCEEGSSPRAIGRQLCSLLSQVPDCPARQGNAPESLNTAVCVACQNSCTRPRVLLPGLSPRSAATRSGAERVSDAHPLFWERLQQLERLLAGAEWLRTTEAKHEWNALNGGRAEVPPVPDVRLVCIDSLNTFGDRPLTRDELSRLLMLFRRYGVVGLCTVERGPDAHDMASSDLVDVLIDLASETDAGYSLRYLEIVKSRYQHQVYGRHPFKIRREEEVKSEWRGPEQQPPRRTLFQAVKVFPSIHHVVASTEPIGIHGRAISGRGGGRERDGFRLGIRALEHVLSPLLARNWVLAVVGERNTYKTPIAHHFLLHGLTSHDPAPDSGRAARRGTGRRGADSALLVRLHEQTSFSPSRPWMLGDDLFPNNRPAIDWEGGFAPCGPWLESSKIVQQCYQYKDGAWLFELALKGGAILPEEFLQFIRNVMRSQPPQHPIRRVVLEDVALIGASYPYLRRSQNAGDLFLSAFVHVMRNYGADLVMLGTKTGLAEADEMVNRACTLADEVLTCEYCDVFGERYVTLRGGGLASGQEWQPESPPRGEHYEMVPAIIVPKPDNNRFGVDPDRLAGLAGFGSPRIYRPGLTLCAFEENTLHRDYNDNLEELIGAAMGTKSRQAEDLGEANGRESGRHDAGGADRVRPKVDVVRFGPSQNETFHDGLGLMSGQPVDATIVATVDEFFMTDERRNVFFRVPQALAERKYAASLVRMRDRMRTSSVHAVPYYASVLFLAFDPRDLDASAFSKVGWKALGRSYSLDVDTSASETGVCVLLDALVPTARWGTFTEDPVRYLEDLRRPGNLRTQVEGQLRALQGLVTRNGAKKRAWVLWYSQLRKRLAEGDAESFPKPDSLDVCALPAGGFTGDWYIGVVDGSVSISLGHKVLTMLCKNKEEYKRLTRGVGLPTARDFYEAGLSAWPGRKAPKLEQLKRIHDNARSRAAVKDYQAIKPVLFDAWTELKADLMTPRALLDALPRRIEVLGRGLRREGA
jgi:hypothetical protein